MKNKFKSRNQARIFLRGLFAAFIILSVIKGLPTANAQNILLIDPSPITFGNIFPGENLIQDFSVSLDQNITQANYKISLLKESDPSTCDFISVHNKENENDNLNSSSLLRPSDIQDLWQVVVLVPIDVDLSQSYSSCSLNIAVLSYNGQLPPSLPTPTQQQISTYGGGIVPISFLSPGGTSVDEKAENFLPAKTPSVATSTNAAAIVWESKNLAKSKIVYDILSHPTASDKLLNFGYSWGTDWGNFTKDHLKNIQGLKPSTKYFYRIGVMTSSGSIFVSPEWHFMTADVITIQPQKDNNKIVGAINGAAQPTNGIKKDNKVPPVGEEKKEPPKTDDILKSRNKALGDFLIVLGILALLLAYYLRKKEKD